jgi:hypothetical protein
VAFVVVLGILFVLGSGARRTQEFSAAYVGLMEGVAVALHHVRTDLRQVCFVPGRPVVPHSIRLGVDGRTILMRRSARVPVRAGPLGSSFVLVEYGLQPAHGRPRGFHLVRAERTKSGANLPSKSTSRTETAFRSFALDGATFAFREDAATGDGTLEISLRVLADVGRSRPAGPFGEKVMLVRNAFAVLRPEPAFSPPTFFAEPVTIPMEALPGDCLAPSAIDADELPDPDGV